MTNQITFEDFQKLDIRIAKIVKAEEIEGADKILKLTLDVGELGERTIVSGIKLQYKPEDLKGKLIVYFSNLEPKVMRSIESQGMLLAAVEENENGENIALLFPDKSVAAGTKIH